MPNMLTDLINPEYSTSNYPGREQLLSKIAGQGYARPPAMPQMIEPATPQTTTRTGEPSWQKVVKERQEKANLQKAFAEIIETREKSGKKFLGGTQRLGILTKYVSPQIANQVNSQISSEQSKAEQMYSVSWVDPESGETRTGLKGREELLKPGGVTTKTLNAKEKLQRRVESGDLTKENATPLQKLILGWKEDRPYKIGQEVERKEGSQIVTRRVTGYDKAGQPVFDKAGEAPRFKPEADKNTTEEKAKQAMASAKFAAGLLKNIAEQNDMVNVFQGIDLSKGLEGLNQTEFKTMSDRAQEIIDDPKESTGNKRAATMYQNNLNVAFELMGGNLGDVEPEKPKGKASWRDYDVGGEEIKPETTEIIAPPSPSVSTPTPTRPHQTASALAGEVKSKVEAERAAGEELKRTAKKGAERVTKKVKSWLAGRKMSTSDIARLKREFPDEWQERKKAYEEGEINYPFTRKFRKQWTK